MGLNKTAILYLKNLLLPSDILSFNCSQYLELVRLLNDIGNDLNELRLEAIDFCSANFLLQRRHLTV